MKHPLDENRPSPVAVGETDSGSVFALLEAARSIQERIESALEELGLSSAKYMALEALVKADEPLTLTDLAGRLRCVRSNITQLVDRLEADGLARREQDAADRRVVRAVVTALGAERQAAGAAATARLHAELAARIDPAERALFQRVVASLR